LAKKLEERSLERLRTKPVHETLKEYQPKWLRHATRMNNNMMPTVMLNYRPSGRRRLEVIWRDSKKVY
jgi:hypothetical protein